MSVRTGRVYSLARNKGATARQAAEQSWRGEESICSQPTGQSWSHGFQTADTWEMEFGGPSPA